MSMEDHQALEVISLRDFCGLNDAAVSLVFRRVHLHYAYPELAEAKATGHEKSGSELRD